MGDQIYELRHFCERSSITDPGSVPSPDFFLFLHKWFLVHASHLQYGSHLQSFSTLVAFNATWCFGHQADTGFYYPDGEIRRKSAGYQDGTGSFQIFFSSCLIGRNLLLTNEKGAEEKGQFPTNGKRDETSLIRTNILFIRRISAG